MKRCARLVLAMLAGMVPGCAPRVLLDNPAGWPENWADRRLFNTPNAFIYATNKGVAGEADRLIQQVANDFRRQTGRQTPKGLLFATDVLDAPLVRDGRQWFEMTEQSKAISENRPALTPPELDEKWVAFEQGVSELGVGADLLLQMVPFHITPEQLPHVLGFSGGTPQDVSWVLVIPTHALVRKCNQTVLRATLEKEGIGPVAQVLVAPMLALAESMAVEGTAVARNIVLFSQFARCQTDWTPEEISTEVEAYADRKMQQVLGPLAGQWASREAAEPI